MGFGWRLLLLLTAMLGIAVFVIWTYYPGYVKAFDERLVKRQTQSFEDQVTEARQLRSQKKEAEAAVILEKVLAELNEARLGDRLGHTKVEVFQALTDAYLEVGELERVLALCEDWLAFNPRDLRADVKKGMALYGMPARRREGAALLDALFAKAPKAKIVADAYASVLFDSGDVMGFLVNVHRATEELHGELTARPWELYWDTGAGFNGRQKAAGVATWVGPHELEVRATMPAGTLHQLRFDAPPWFPLALVTPVFVSPTGGAGTLALADLRLGLHDFERHDGLFLGSGPDPFIEARLPQPVEVGADSELVFRAIALPGSAAKLAEILRDPKRREALSYQVSASGRPELAGFLNEVMSLLLSAPTGAE